MEVTPQEFKISELIAKGYSEKEIASQLFVSPATVHNHTYNIRKKNGLRSAVDIAREFILSLDNPKQYFAAIMFLIIQINISAFGLDVFKRYSPNRINRAKITRVKIK